MSSYDETLKTQYIEGGGGWCPECESDSSTVYTNPSRPEAGISVRIGQCNTCSAIWREVLILDDIELIQHGAHHNITPAIACTG